MILVTFYHIFFGMLTDVYVKAKEHSLSGRKNFGLRNDKRLEVAAQNLGPERITQIAMILRNPDVRSHHFIVAISNVPLEKFRCNTIQKSTPQVTAL
jgi:hypothetical protein